jgi:integrase
VAPTLTANVLRHPPLDWRGSEELAEMQAQLRALLRAGQGLSELQARMGHASIKTTEIYLRAIRAGGGQRQVVGAPL